MRKYLEESINLLLLLEPSRCNPFKHTLKQKQLCLKLIFVWFFFKKEIYSCHVNMQKKSSVNV